MESSLPDRSPRFIRLLSRSERRLSAYVLSLTGNFADADEVMQEVRCRLWEELDRFEEGTSFPAWAMTVARFEVMSWQKRRARSKVCYSQGLIDTLAQELPALLEEADQRAHALGQCMDRLPADSRALLGRVYGEGWRIAAAAKETGRSEAAVYKTLQRARHWLRDCITRRLGEVGA